MTPQPHVAAPFPERMWQGIVRWLIYRVKRVRRRRRHRALPIFGISKHVRRDIGDWQ